MPGTIYRLTSLEEATFAHGVGPLVALLVTSQSAQLFAVLITVSVALNSEHLLLGVLSEEILGSLFTASRKDSVELFPLVIQADGEVVHCVARRNRSCFVPHCSLQVLRWNSKTQVSSHLQSQCKRATWRVSLVHAFSMCGGKDTRTRWPTPSPQRWPGRGERKNVKWVRHGKRQKMDALRFNLNGVWQEERALSPTLTLLRYLRDRKGMTGTKEGCAEGDCGACTVAVAERGSWRAVNSCLVLLPMLQGKHVLTVEALRSDKAYHPAQEAMAKALGSQCGYCTPGIVMSLFEATYRKDLDAPWKLDDQLCGNLCRCTGYRPIKEAALAVAGSCPDDRFSKLLTSPESMRLNYEATGQRFCTPNSLDELWAELKQHPDTKFVNGGTDLSLEVTKRFKVLPKLVSLEGLAELKTLSETGDTLHLGSGATIAEIEAFTASRIPSVHRMVRYFGARQIKHRGTLGGNLCTASPIGDLAPVLISLGATAVIRSSSRIRRLPLEQFFVGYRKTALEPGELLLAVEVPRVPASARAASYKVSKRRELDISTVSAGFYIDTDASGVVTVARLAYGGMAATTARAKSAEGELLGKPWTEASVARAAEAVSAEFSPLSDHRGSAAYRTLLAANLLRGFWEETRDVKQPSLQNRHVATVQTTEGVAHD